MRLPGPEGLRGILFRLDIKARAVQTCGDQIAAHIRIGTPPFLPWEWVISGAFCVKMILAPSLDW